jgi:hypothetical protein
MVMVGEPKGEGTMEDFLKFKKMLTPIIIQILFWVSVAACVLFGFMSIARGVSSSYGGGFLVFFGLMWILVGPVVVRIYCELLIVIFSINDTLTEVKDLLKNRGL